LIKKKELSSPSALGLWSDLFTSIVASIFGLHSWVFLMMHGDGVGHFLLLLLFMSLYDDMLEGFKALYPNMTLFTSCSLGFVVLVASC
jgi:hypothetical protein